MVILENENEFLLRNLWWIVLLALVLISGITFWVVFFIRNKKSEPKKTINISDNLSAIGGRENVLSHNLSGSRIILVLRNYDLVDKEKLKKAGATGFILKSDKLTIVFKDEAEEVYKSLFN